MMDPSLERRHSGVHSGPAARTVRVPVAHDADLQRSIVPHYEKGTSTVALRNVDARNINLPSLSERRAKLPK